MRCLPINAAAGRGKAFSSIFWERFARLQSPQAGTVIPPELINGRSRPARNLARHAIPRMKRVHAEASWVRFVFQTGPYNKFNAFYVGPQRPGVFAIPAFSGEIVLAR